MRLYKTNSKSYMPSLARIFLEKLNILFPNYGKTLSLILLTERLDKIVYLILLFSYKLTNDKSLLKFLDIKTR